MTFLGFRVNGHLFQSSSIEVKIGPIPVQNIIELSYSNQRTIGTLYGFSSVKRGRTKGREEPTGSITMYKEDGDALLDITSGLGIGGYGENSFDLTVTYFEAGLAGVPIIDSLIGCQIIGDEDSHSDGTDVLRTVFTLDIVRILRNGKAMTGGLSDVANLITGALGI
jgi:hypothetical protein